MTKWVSNLLLDISTYHLKSIRVVECPEFHDLCMLLRESLEDNNIPRCDKVWEAIINEWRKQFELLKGKLNVKLCS